MAVLALQPGPAMIRYLSIQRLAVIDQIALELGPGLTVLTGETGAGKSILVEAVQLLLGGRSSTDLVRTGEETAIVQAIIDRPDGSELIVRREISAQGRSRAFLDGQLVTTASLREAISDLIDLHGQHEHQALLSPSTQLSLLDRYGRLDDERETLAGLHTRLTDARSAIDAFDTSLRERRERIDLLEVLRHEIDRAAPRAGEDDELTAERNVVANAEKIGRLAAESYAALYDDDQAVLARLAFVWKRVTELADIDARFRPFLEARDGITAPLDDLARLLRDHHAGIDTSPGRLQAIEDRLALLERLKRRCGPTLADVLARRSSIESELSDLDSSPERRDALAAALREARDGYRAAARALSKRRVAAAARLARALEASLADLAMGGTRCDIRITTSEEDESRWHPSGYDQVELLLSANVGEDLRPLARIASGGELSRVMLAMKTLASTDLPGKTLIFDEVDAGIGGGVADVVGERLRTLSDGCQVLCITHLPQVAAFADAHVRVSKSVAGDRTVTHVDALTTDVRIEELARMMGGRDLTAKVREGARDLLESRARRKAKAKGESPGYAGAPGGRGTRERG